MLSMRPRNVSAQAQDQDQNEQTQTHDHMTGMEAYQRVESRAKKVSADREVISKDQSLPFQGGEADVFTRRKTRLIGIRPRATAREVERMTGTPAQMAEEILARIEKAL